MSENHNCILYLKPYAEEDVPDLAPLFADADSMRYYLPGMWRTFNAEQLKSLMSDWHDAQNNFVYTIRSHLDEKEEIIGVLNFDSVDWVQKNAEMGIILLPEARGRGFALQAANLALKQAFLQMNLHRIFVRIIASNSPSIKLFKRLGFKEEGLMREHVFRDGKYENMYLLGLLAEEYTALAE